MALRGIDVSNWQPHVDWPAMKHSGVSFAYLKASEGTDFSDKMYSTHRRNARAAGLVIGAYHFARPSTGSAKAQALHFLKVADVHRGDLTPALDLEVTGGLSPAHLVGWTAIFRDTVMHEVGVRPVIYTSPGFWSSAMANSRLFAACPLWVAHWGVGHPTLPAGWRDYAVWQYQGSPLDRDRAETLPLYRPDAPKPDGVLDKRFSPSMYVRFMRWLGKPATKPDGVTRVRVLPAVWARFMDAVKHKKA